MCLTLRALSQRQLKTDVTRAILPRDFVAYMRISLPDIIICGYYCLPYGYQQHDYYQRYPHVGLCSGNNCRRKRQIISLITAHCNIAAARICGKRLCNVRVSIRPSVCLSVPSTGSSSDVHLVCCSSARAVDIDW